EVRWHGWSLEKGRGPASAGPRVITCRRRLRLAAQLELAALGLAEACLAFLGLQLAQNCRVQSRGWGLAARRSPVALGGHGVDHLLTVHGLTLLGEHLGGGVQGAGLLGL